MCPVEIVDDMGIERIAVRNLVPHAINYALVTGQQTPERACASEIYMLLAMRH